MGESPRQSWVRTAVLLGIGYALVGIAFAVPATHMQAWRLAAWVVSAIGYAVHIAYERFRLQNSPGSAALHVAFAVALDRKSTRLNSSHLGISYAVFCLKKKTHHRLL